MDESPSILVYLLSHFRVSHVSKKNSDSVDRTLLKQSDDASNIFTLLREMIEDGTSARKKLESDLSAYKSQTNDRLVQLEKQNDESPNLIHLFYCYIYAMYNVHMCNACWYLDACRK